MWEWVGRKEIRGKGGSEYSLGRTFFPLPKSVENVVVLYGEVPVTGLSRWLIILVLKL